MKLLTTLLTVMLSVLLWAPTQAGAVSVSVSPATASVGQNVNISVSSSSIIPGCQMFVDFGDGTSTGFTCTTSVFVPKCIQNYNHSYTTPGTYKITSGSTFTNCATLPDPAAANLNVTCPALSISTNSLPDGTVGSPYSAQLGSTGGQPPFTWSLANEFGTLPPGLNLSPTGLISGTPSQAISSSYSFQVADSCNPIQTDVKVFGLTVQPSCPALSVTTTSLPPATAGQFYSFQLQAAGGSLPLAWEPGSNTPNLPPGLNLSPSGLISGTPTQAGNFFNDYQVSDQCSPKGQLASTPLTLTVNPAPAACPALSISTPTNLPGATAGENYQQQILTQGGTAPINFALLSGTLPTGITLSPTGQLSGQPTNSGSYTFTLRATDHCLNTPKSQERSFNLVVMPAACAPLNFSAGGATMESGQPYSQPFGLSGGQGATTVTLVSGSLPPGLNLSPNGLGGTPTTPGSYGFTLRASDSCKPNPQNIDRTLTLTVNAPATSGGGATPGGGTNNGNGSACQPLALLDQGTLPAAQAGHPYTYQFRTSGGSGTVTISLLSDLLPAGLSMSPQGLLNGTPNESGQFNLLVGAMDSCASGPQNASGNYLLSLSSSNAGLSVSPAQSFVARRNAAQQSLLYTASGPGSFSSARGEFLADGTVIGSVDSPLVINSVSTATVTENLRIPVGIVRRAEEMGLGQFRYRRQFNGPQGPLTTEAAFTLTSAATAQLRITRMDLSFNNGRPEITVRRNQTGLQAKAELRFDGNGPLRGFWEVDGRVIEQVNQHLVYGQSITLRTPALPPLPTFEEGYHRVRLVISEPQVSFALPEAVYFVTAAESKMVLQPIELLEPKSGLRLPYRPFTLRWQGPASAEIYLLEIRAEREGDVLASAYIKAPRYELPQTILEDNLTPGGRYLWQVKGFDHQGNMIARSDFASFRLARRVAFVPKRLLLYTDGGHQNASTLQQLFDQFALAPVRSFDLQSLNLHATLVKTATPIEKLIPQLQQEKILAAVQPNYLFATAAQPEPMAGLSPLTQDLQLEKLHSSFQGAGARVAVIDTGVDSRHEELHGRVVLQRNLLPDSSYIGEIHGTAVAGIIAAAINHKGISGIAPKANLLALRACRQLSAKQPEGECFSSSLQQALDLAIREKADVVNMSYGSPRVDPILARLLDKAAEKRILLVASAGNDPRQEELSFPASHPKVVAVAGKKRDGTPYPNPVLAAKADLIVTAENLFTTTPGNGYNFLSGTSFSAAAVSGLLALRSAEGEVTSLPTLQAGEELCAWQEQLFERSLCHGKTAQQAQAKE